MVYYVLIALGIIINKKKERKKKQNSRMGLIIVELIDFKKRDCK